MKSVLILIFTVSVVLGMQSDPKIGVDKEQPNDLFPPFTPPEDLWAPSDDLPPER